MNESWKKAGHPSIKSVENLIENSGIMLKRNCLKLARYSRLTKMMKQLQYQKHHQNLSQMIASSSKKVRKQSLFILTLSKLHRVSLWLTQKKEHLIKIITQLIKHIEQLNPEQKRSVMLLESVTSIKNTLIKVYQSNLFKMTEFQTLFAQKQETLQLKPLVQENLDQFIANDDPLAEKHFYELLFLKCILETPKAPSNQSLKHFKQIDKHLNNLCSNSLLPCKSIAMGLTLEMMKFPEQNCPQFHQNQLKQSDIQDWSNQLTEKQYSKDLQQIWWNQMYFNMQNMFYFNYFPQFSFQSMLQTEEIGKEKEKVQERKFVLENIEEDVSSYPEEVST